MIVLPIHEYNANHEPAGTPVGGRFARKAGGSLASSYPKSSQATGWGTSFELPAKTAVEALDRLRTLHYETLDNRLGANRRVQVAREAVTKAWDIAHGPARSDADDAREATAAARAANAELKAAEKAKDLLEGAVLGAARDIIRAENRGQVRWGIDSATISDQDRSTIMQGIEAVENLVDASLLPAVHIRGIDYGERSNADGPDLQISQYSPVDTVVHEIGHAIETSHESVLKAAVDFRNRHTLDKNPTTAMNKTIEALSVPLASLQKDSGYAAHEVALPDTFADPYVGKVYDPYPTRKAPQTYTDRYFKKHRATEVTSMGLQLMYADPAWMAISHPDHFETIFNAMRGR